jgi:hypothetical protein
LNKWILHFHLSLYSIVYLIILRQIGHRKNLNDFHVANKAKESQIQDHFPQIKTVKINRKRIWIQVNRWMNTIYSVTPLFCKELENPSGKGLYPGSTRMKEPQLKNREDNSLSHHDFSWRSTASIPGPPSWLNHTSILPGADESPSLLAVVLWEIKM